MTWAAELDDLRKVRPDRYLEIVGKKAGASTPDRPRSRAWYEFDYDCDYGLPPPYTRTTRLLISKRTGQRIRVPGYCDRITCEECKLRMWKPERAWLQQVAPAVVFGFEDATEDEWEGEMQRIRLNLRRRRVPIDVNYRIVMSRERTRTGLASHDLTPQSGRMVTMNLVTEGLPLLDRAHARRDLAKHKARVATKPWRAPKKKGSGEWQELGRGNKRTITQAERRSAPAVDKVVERAGGDLTEHDLLVIQGLVDTELDTLRGIDRS